MFRKIHRAAALLVACAALNYAVLTPAALAAPSLVSPTISHVQSRIPNLIKVDDNLYRGRQPDLEALRQLKEAGIKVDVSLCNEKSLVAQEIQDAKQVGLKFINIPMSALKRPTADAIQQFLAVVGQKDKEPVFFHCRHGQDRTGAMCGLYRVVLNGWSPDDAFKEMIQDGFHPFFFGLTNVVFDAAEAIGHFGPRPSIGTIATHIGRPNTVTPAPKAE